MIARMVMSLAALMVGRGEIAARDLFVELLGRSSAEVDAKIDAAHRQLFHGDDETGRVYYPVGDDMAYMLDVGNNDVRSEGMSYGMMIAAQLDRQDEFDRIWKWAKTHMYHAEGPLRGYFAWHCAPDGTRLSEGPASDGEEWLAMALFFAANRWGSREGIFDYRAEADAILRVMLRKSDEGHEDPTSMFDPEAKQVLFVPWRRWAGVTDPSYHLPAFYELWARWAREDREFWAEAAKASREFFKKAAHPRTGLMPDYAHFDGTPRVGGGHEDFRFDAWRTLANVALDHAWWRADPWQVEQSNRVLRFLDDFRPNIPNQFAIDGRPLTEDFSIGLVAMAAVAGLAAEPDVARPFVRMLWDAPVPRGQWRYYNGMLYLLGYLQASGRFQIFHPADRLQPP